MASPARLLELRCPRCGGSHWEIDNDYRGFDPADLGAEGSSYAERTYRCPVCGATGTNYSVLQKGPEYLFSQPIPTVPMSVAEFEHWVTILRAHFPNNHFLGELGTRWYPSGGYEPYQERFPVGSIVRVAEREVLERFSKEWRYHHPLEPERLRFAGTNAVVAEVDFYFSGEALYVLKGVPGQWHEACLTPDDSEG